MNDKYAFLKSTRFWAVVIGAAMAYLEAKGWVGEAERNFLIAVAGGFVTIRTVDRVADKKVEAAEVAVEAEK